MEHDGFIETVTGKGSFVAGRNTELLREEQLRRSEEFLQSAVNVARASGITQDELIVILKLIYTEE